MNNRNTNWTLPLVIAAIVGIIVGILFFNGTIVAGIIGTPILFATIFASVSLILLFLGVTFAERKDVKGALNEYGRPLLGGSVGTIVAGFFGLTFIASLVAGSIVAALLVSFGTFFFVLTFWSLVKLIICLIENLFGRREEYCNFDNNCN